MGPHTPIPRRVPPMLYITLAELMCSRAQKMLACQARFGVDERHRVLQLVAKSKCPAGLIETAAPPKTTAQYLIQQPAVGHQVYRCVGSFHADHAQRLLPILPNAFAGRSGGSGFTTAFDQVSRVRQIASGSKTKPDLSFLSVQQINCDLHDSARIKPCPRFS